MHHHDLYYCAFIQLLKPKHLLDVSPLFLKLLGILVVDYVKRLATISKVARVDSDFLKAFSYQHGNGRLKMYVRNEWNIIAVSMEGSVWSVVWRGVWKDICARGNCQMSKGN